MENKLNSEIEENPVRERGMTRRSEVSGSLYGLRKDDATQKALEVNGRGSREQGEGQMTNLPRLRDRNGAADQHTTKSPVNQEPVYEQKRVMTNTKEVIEE